MDKKIELEVLNISESLAQVGAFALLLGEVNGTRQLPIIIGPAEAQATAVHIKGIKTARPMTHDLFLSTLNILGAAPIRVLIYKTIDGVFYSYIYLKKENEIIRVDSRTSDAIALAVRANCPIFVYESILDQECLRHLDTRNNLLTNRDDEEDDENENEMGLEQKEKLSRSATSMSLEEALEQAIENEDYELAAKIRDQINSNKQNQ